MRNLFLFIFIFSFSNIPNGYSENDQGFIYGKITTVSGQSYVGQIRWGKEEIYWNDFFNSTKTSKSVAKYDIDGQDKSSKEKWGDFDWTFSSIWADKHSNSSHRFGIRFGDIRSLIFRSREKVTVVLKNGAKLDVVGGSNDIGTYVKIYDEEIGHVDLKWDRLERIDFMATPKKLDSKFGNPLHGVVETYRKGKFEGMIQWDHDERIGSDILNGESKDGDVDIAFDKIRILESKNNGTMMTTKSGREFYLTGSNDVNNGNRGIIVSVDGLGKIDIPWKEFNKVTFVDKNGSGPSYDSFSTPTAIRGKVKVIDGNTIEGMIIYDLDESWDFEFLDGKDDNIDYFIPFRNIKKITPKNYNYSMVTLRNGEEILLGDTRDVNESNGGLLIFTRDREEPKYVKWKTIDEILLD